MLKTKACENVPSSLELLSTFKSSIGIHHKMLNMLLLLFRKCDRLSQQYDKNNWNLYDDKLKKFNLQ